MAVYRRFDPLNVSPGPMFFTAIPRLSPWSPRFWYWMPKLRATVLALNCMIRSDTRLAVMPIAILSVSAFEYVAPIVMYTGE